MANRTCCRMPRLILPFCHSTSPTHLLLVLNHWPFITLTLFHKLSCHRQTEKFPYEFTFAEQGGAHRAHQTETKLMHFIWFISSSMSIFVARRERERRYFDRRPANTSKKIGFVKKKTEGCTHTHVRSLSPSLYLSLSVFIATRLHH